MGWVGQEILLKGTAYRQARPEKCGRYKTELRTFRWEVALWEAGVRVR